MDNAVALFSGSPISALNIVKPARKRKNSKRAKTFPEMSPDTAPYKVFGSFGDIECKKRRIQQVGNKNITDSGFIQYLTSEEEPLGQMLSKHPDDLWLSNQVPSKNRDMTNGNTNQNYFFQAQPESVNALHSQMVNCPYVPSQQNKPSVSVTNTEKTYQATCNLNDTSDCNQILTITNEVANLDSFSLILNDIVNSASRFEPANSELLTQSQGLSGPMTMSQELAPVLPPLKSSKPLPITMSKGQPTYAMLIGHYMPKNMPKELTSHASSKWNSVPLTTSKSGKLEGKTLTQRNSSPLSTNSVEAASLTSRNSMSMTSSQLLSGNQSQQLNNSMQWASNQANLVQPSHSVQLEQKGQPLSSAQFPPSRDSIIKSFNGQPKQMQEDIIRKLKKRMLRESEGLAPPDLGITFQEMFTQATNSIMHGVCTPGESTYTSAATDKSTSTFHYTSSQHNYTDAQPTYIAEKSINTQSSSIPTAYTRHSNTKLSNTHVSFRQITNTQPSKSQHGYNQTTNLQPTFNQITQMQPANYNLAQTPSNTQVSNVVSSLRQTANTQPANPQSANNQIANLPPAFRQTANTRLTNPQSADNQTANLQPAFRHTVNTLPTNPQSANNQTANLQSTTRQTNNTHFARYQSAPTPPLNTNLPDIQTSFRLTANSQTHNSQSGYTEAPNAQPSFIDTTNKQPSHPQLTYTQNSNSQQTNLQTTFRQTTNTHLANPQHAYFLDSSEINQSASIPTQEPMDFLLTPPPYTSTSNYFSTTISDDSLARQFKTQNFENGLLSDLSTPTIESSTPDFTSLTNMESIPSSPKAEDDDLLSSNNDSFYINSTPSLCLFSEAEYAGNTVAEQQCARLAY